MTIHSQLLPPLTLASASATLAGDILDGGDGTDTLSITSATGNGQTAGYTGMSNFEVLSFSDAAWRIYNCYELPGWANHSYTS